MVYDSVSKSMDRGGLTDLILFDFSKAFDVVAHSLLLEKLRCLGIQGRTLSAICSFLTDRSMSVCIQNHTNQPRPVLGGVPQGSVLGPLLFLVYVNSIASELSCSHNIFADDLKIYACVKYPNSPEHTPSSSTTIQRDIDILSSMVASWDYTWMSKGVLSSASPDFLPSWALPCIPWMANLSLCHQLTLEFLLTQI